MGMLYTEKKSHAKKILFIAGCTGTGKTEVALSTCKKHQNACIINCDSVQIYRHMNIGSNKTIENHALVNLCHFKESFDVEMYITAFDNIVFGEHINIEKSKDDNEQQKVCANTNSFIKHKEDISLASKEANPNDAMPKLMLVTGGSYLYMDRIFKYLDLLKHGNIQNVKYSHLLQLYMTKNDDNKHIFNAYFPKIFLTMDRNALYRKLDKRCEKMILSGLLDEVIELKKENMVESDMAAKAIGYCDMLAFINKLHIRCCTGISELEQSDIDLLTQLFYEHVDKFMTRTRNYAKKQECWHRGKDFLWIDVGKYDAEYIVCEILRRNIFDCKYWWRGKMLENDTNETVIKLDELHEHSYMLNLGRNHSKFKAYKNEYTLLSTSKVQKLIRNLICTIKAA